MSELQIVIECFIQENGGNDKLAEIIETEWCKYFAYGIRREWTKREELFILTNYDRKSVNKIAIILRRTNNSIKNKIQYMREKSLIDYKNHII